MPGQFRVKKVWLAKYACLKSVRTSPTVVPMRHGAAEFYTYCSIVHIIIIKSNLQYLFLSKHFTKIMYRLTGGLSADFMVKSAQAPGPYMQALRSYKDNFEGI